MTDKGEAEQTKKFEQVLARELEYFKAKGRLHAGAGNKCQDIADEDECGGAYAACVVEQANRARLTGLAFSGGGIRSATFNLGVLQALARLKLLDQFDYLSTVSGGGYIGSWFTAWIHRVDASRAKKAQTSVAQADATDDKIENGLESVACELAASVSARDDRRFRAAMQPDPAPVSHLREYSNYLSPRRGFWSTDAWTLGVTYLRNLVLTFSLLLATLVTLVLATRAMVSLYFRAAHAQFENAYLWVPLLFIVSIFIAAVAVGIELCGVDSNKRKTRLCSNVAVFAGLCAAATGAIWLWQVMVSPLAVFATSLANVLPWDFDLLLLDLFDDSGNLSLIIEIIPVGFFGLLGWVLGLLFGKWQAARSLNCAGQTSADSVSPSGSFVARVVSGVISLFAFIALVMLLGAFMLKWLPFDVKSWDPQLWLIVVWGTPLLVLVFSIVAVVFVGVAGSALNELEREWMGRFFAALTKWTALITSLVALVVYAPCWVQWLGDYALAPASLWGLLSAGGAYLARNTVSANSALQSWLKKILLAIAPYVFILGMLVLTVWATDKAVQWLAMYCELIVPANGDVPGYWYLMAKLDVSFILLMCLAAALFTLLWSWRVGVNRFSLHSMYADRLIRAYLGASNLERKVHPFSGFSANDNEVYMADLAGNNSHYSGPYPIINTAINLVSSKRLAWQKRKAASFFFTPLFCGYEYCAENESSVADAHCTDKDTDRNANRDADRHKRREGGFVASDHFTSKHGRGVSLGKAMAISGAAASPNMGYHSSPALTFLMTTFNVRLGWWLPNTSKNSPAILQKRGPGAGLLYLMYELLGMTNASRNYVYLSDGGHFENLAIYELVRRRCRLIVACDAEADPELTFSGLGSAIEKCQTDLGVPIKIDVSHIRRDAHTGLSPWHCAIGCIRYSEADVGQADGILVYIKSSLTGDEPQNVATYAESHASFPHETTADQWFDESQFESYRTLGEHTIYKVLGNAVQVAETARREHNERLIERVILEARKQWYPGASLQVNEPADHDALLGTIMDTLRNDAHLRFLDEQLYPNLRRAADAYAYQKTESFFS